ncbi:MAG: 3-dehydroquinate synthase [Candidatus Acidiferrales bacterium]
MPSIPIASSSGPYDFYCASGALARSASLIKRLGGATGVFVLSSPRVWRYWGRAIVSKLPGTHARHPILFDDRESSKRLSMVEQIARALSRSGADRHAILVAVGGGVVGDVAGFAAASFLRGVRLVHIPTTLVAQVDSSIGGKTGVNLPEGKNLVGAFYPPKLIVADPETLQTLPHREYRSGLYEVVKYGVIADPELFAFLERHMPAALRCDPAALASIIPRCAAIKARVVTKDEHEGGLRQILNFGHTLGHALETATGYRRFLHGEAIGWGMMAATLLAVGAGRLREPQAGRILRVISSIGPLPSLGKISASQLRPILEGDKKARGGRTLWVLPRRIGSAEWGAEVPWPIVARSFAELPAIAARARE